MALPEEKLRELIQEFIADLEFLLGEIKEVKEKEGSLTKRALLELISHEAIVPEAYKDSVGVWTWGIGVTGASGHKVFPRYKDNPTSIARVIEIFKWLVEDKYLPDVLEAFEGTTLKEHELAAALSFHYNTGAIKRASWVKSFKEGNRAVARQQFMNWKRPPEIIGRRKKERDLFFDGRWSSDGTTLIYDVSKPSYKPTRPRRVDISEEL